MPHQGNSRRGSSRTVRPSKGVARYKTTGKAGALLVWEGDAKAAFAATMSVRGPRKASHPGFTEL
jgi:hypothetical protein